VVVDVTPFLLVMTAVTIVVLAGALPTEVEVEKCTAEVYDAPNGLATFDVTSQRTGGVNSDVVENVVDMLLLNTVETTVVVFGRMTYVVQISPSGSDSHAVLDDTLRVVYVTLDQLAGVTVVVAMSFVAPFAMRLAVELPAIEEDDPVADEVFAVELDVPFGEGRIIKAIGGFVAADELEAETMPNPISTMGSVAAGFVAELDVFDQIGELVIFAGEVTESTSLVPASLLALDGEVNNGVLVAEVPVCNFVGVKVVSRVTALMRFSVREGRSDRVSRNTVAEIAVPVGEFVLSVVVEVAVDPEQVARRHATVPVLTRFRPTDTPAEDESFVEALAVVDIAESVVADAVHPPASKQTAPVSINCLLLVVEEVTASEVETTSETVDET
jgi:hypothetical protein